MKAFLPRLRRLRVEPLEQRRLLDGEVAILDAWASRDDDAGPFSYSVSAGSDRALVFVVSAEHSSSIGNVDGVTWGGQALTWIDTAVATAGGENQLEVWYLDEAGITAATGSTFVISGWSGGADPSDELYAAVSLENVDQTVPLGDHSPGSATAASSVQPASPLDKRAGDLVLYATATGEQGRTHTAPEYYVEGNEIDSGGVGQVLSQATRKIVITGGTEQPAAQWSGGSNNRLVMVGAVFQHTNLPPEADAGGPYAVDEGQPVALDAYASWDPEGDTVFVSETFMNDTTPSWTLYDDAILTSGGADPSGEGWLRLTNDTGNQNGAAIYNTAIDSGDRVRVTFDFATYSNTGGSADGITFFLMDGSETSPAPGAYGGSLGYAQRDDPLPGLTHGYLGVGLDEYGNFANPTEGRQGGPGFRPNTVTVRGSGDGQATTPDNYQWIATSPDLGTLFGGRNLALVSGTRPDQMGADYRRAIVMITPNGVGDLNIRVELQFGYDTDPVQVISETVTVGGYQDPVPATFKFGFTASTGGETNYHEIRNFEITTISASTDLTYAWDLDNDGSYDDATGVDPTIPWATLAAMGLPSDGTPVPVGLRVTDADLASDTDATTLTINNLPPTDIALSNSTLPENAPVGTTVGVFSSVDPGTNDTHAYSLVAGAGDTDNNLFTIAGNVLRTNAVLDYETKSTYSVRVQADDGEGGAYEEQLTIALTPVNDNVPVAYSDDMIVLARGGTQTALASGAASVLANDVDADLPGDTLTAILDSGPSYGAAFTFNPDGTFSYTHDGSGNLADSFTYHINDGVRDGNVATVSIVIDPALVGNLVWYDLDGDGIQDAGEPGIEGAAVELVSSVDLVVGNGDDVSLGATVTDAAGQYSLVGLTTVVNYYVRFRVPVGNPAYAFTTQNAGGDDALDSDAAATGTTAMFTPAAGGDDFTVDAGLVNGPAPAFGFAVRAGAGNADQGRAVATDADGNVYVTGSFQGTADFDHGPGTYNLTSAGNNDIFVAKYSSTGALVWARRMGAAGNDYGYGIAVGADGSVHTTGSFRNTVDFDPGAGTYNLTSGGSDDIFVSKLNSDGNFVWARRFAGTGNNSDVGWGIALGADGSVHTTGGFRSTVDFDPGAGTYNLTSAGSDDIFVSKLDSAGNFVWARRFAGTGNNSDVGWGIALGADGSVHTTGGFRSTVDFDPGAGTYNLTSAGSDDIFVSKLDSAGNFVWARRLTGTGNNSDVGYGIALGADGSVHTTGAFRSTVDFDPGAGTYNLTSGGGADVFVAKLDSAGNFDWARRLAGATATDDVAYAIAVAIDGTVFTTGYFQRTVDFDPGAGVYNLASFNNSNDVFLSRLDSDGSFRWAGQLGGTSADVGYGVAVTDDGKAHVTGAFQGTADFDPGAGTFNLTSGGGSDFFLANPWCNKPPTADDGGPYAINEGQPLVLDGSGSSDPDGDVLTYAWDLDNDGAYDDATGSGPTIPWLTLVAFGFPTDGTPLTMGLRVTDPFSATDSAATTFQINNLPPTDITLSNASVAENEPIGAVVGAFSSVDPGTTDTHMYSLVAGAGDTDNGSFTIVGGNLRTNAVFDYETQNTYSIRVETNDGEGGTFQKQFTITVTDVYEGLVGNMVWRDLDGNGVQNVGEPGIEGAVVELFSSSDGIVGNGDDVSVAVAITSAGGRYLFAGLTLGSNYYVQCRMPVGDPAYAFTTQNVGGDDTIDSDADASGNTPMVTMSADDVTLDVGLVNGPAPSFGFALRAGGADYEQAWGVAADGDGNAYMVGSFKGTPDFDHGPGTVSLTSTAGSVDAFVAKYSMTGALVWARRMGGTDWDDGYGIAVAGDGSVYVTGCFRGAAADFGTDVLASDGAGDIFVAKLDSDGNFLWARRMGGTGWDDGYAIAVAGDGSVYSTGYFSGTADFDPGAGTYNLDSDGQGDVYLSRLDASGDFLGAQRMGGTDWEIGYGVTVDGGGNVHLVGYFCGTADFDPGGGVASLTSVGDADVFAAKLDTAGNLLWARRMGGTGWDYACGIALADDGSVYTAGYFYDAADFGATILTSAGDADIFAVKFDAAGSLLWAREMGGPGYDGGFGMAVAGDGTIYTTGSFNGTADFDPGAGTYNLASAGGGDVFLSQLDANGVFVWAGQMGGTGEDSGYGIAPSDTGCIYTAGSFFNTSDFDPGAGTFNLASAGDSDIFLSDPPWQSSANEAPTADSGGPYSGDLGTIIAVSATASSDPGQDIASYQWDLDNDGQFDDGTGVTAAYNATTKGRFTIRVQVTDDDGASNIAAATVTVDNETVGLYNPTTGAFYLRNHNDAGYADWAFNYGPAGLGWLPIAGDWNNDGIDTVGLYDPATGTFHLKNTNAGGAADVAFRYGPAGSGWQPVVGDWNGDGIDTIGLYDPDNARVCLRDSNTSGVADVAFDYGPGGLGWQPVAGDWDDDGTDTVGLYDPAGAVFYLRNDNSSGSADVCVAYGPTALGWTPLIGDWNANGTDTIGLYDAASASYFLRNSNDSGFADEVFGYGPAGLGWQPIVGDWDDTSGLLRAAAGDCPDFRGGAPCAAWSRENGTVPFRPDDPLTQADLASIIARAIADWAGAEVAVDLLESLDFVIADLPGSQIGRARSDAVFLDLDAAGHGWFIDPTPAADEEFTLGTAGSFTAIDPAAVDRIDLLTVVSHELGHVLGLDDLDRAADGLMSGLIAPGVRREIGAAEIDALFARR